MPRPMEDTEKWLYCVRCRFEVKDRKTVEDRTHSGKTMFDA